MDALRSMEYKKYLYLKHIITFTISWLQSEYMKVYEFNNTIHTSYSQNNV